MCFRRGHLEDLKRLCRSCPANGSALLLLLLRGRDLAISGHPVRRRHLELRSRETDRPVTSSVDRHLPATCSSTQNRAKNYNLHQVNEEGRVKPEAHLNDHAAISTGRKTRPMPNIGKRNHNLTRKLSEHVVESKTKQTMDIQYEIVDTECIMKMKFCRTMTAHHRTVIPFCSPENLLSKTVLTKTNTNLSLRHRNTQNTGCHNAFDAILMKSEYDVFSLRIFPPFSQKSCVQTRPDIFRKC
ncbi:hypothetical protein F2P81_019873 [Scophthalmus maximus]|uniref:Uncharacterized protein n=1 Tax=Scophthalmus maximus TaxID=52904 RepID=A0A6A4S7F2_SCOMX|nr:hypothetical protein F2P81_019873 [Scophthalmus maximus]